MPLFGDDNAAAQSGPDNLLNLRRHFERGFADTDYKDTIEILERKLPATRHDATRVDAQVLLNSVARVRSSKSSTEDRNRISAEAAH